MPPVVTSTCNHQPQQHMEPHPSLLTRGKGGCRGCHAYCACCPCCPTHADCAAPGPPPPPHRITACHPTPQHDTNTPPPPHGRSGQDITGVAVEEGGGGSLCVSPRKPKVFRCRQQLAVAEGCTVCHSSLVG